MPTLPTSTWGQETDANRIKKTYVKGYMDVSGGELSVHNTAFNVFNIDGSGVFRMDPRKITVNDDTGQEVDISLSYLTFLNTLVPVGGQAISIPDKVKYIFTLGTETRIGKPDASSNFRVFGNTYIEQDLFVTGDISLNNDMDISGSLTVRTHLKLPVGGNDQRPVTVNEAESAGYIRYNTDNSQFEGYGPGDSWGSLGGVINVSQNTKIIASSPDPDSVNNELQFFTAPTGSTLVDDTKERMRILANGDISMNARLLVASDASLNGNLYVAAKTRLGNDLSLNGNFTMYGDASLNGRLMLSGDASLNGNLYVAAKTRLGNDLSLNGNLFVYGGDASLNGRLFVANDTSLNGNLFVRGRTTFYEPSGSVISSGTSRGTLNLTHGDASGGSSILFQSVNSADNDYAYIQYQENVPYAGQVSTEAGLLTIGIENEITSAHRDRISLWAANGSGNVGVNNKFPNYNLDVSGTLNASNTLSIMRNNTITQTPLTNPKIEIGNGGGISRWKIEDVVLNRDGGAGPNFDYGAQSKLIISAKSNNLFNNTANDLAYIDGMTLVPNSGGNGELSTRVNVGIGTTNPTYNLDVSGQMRIYEGIGTIASATTGSLMLEHTAVGGTSSIMFKGPNSTTNDYAYIQYEDNTGHTLPLLKYDFDTSIGHSVASTGSNTNNIENVNDSISSVAVSGLSNPPTQFPVGAYCLNFQQTNITSGSTDAVSYMQTPGSLTPFNAGGFTFSAWIRPRTTNATNCRFYILNISPSSSTSKFDIYLNGDTGRIVAICGEDSTNYKHTNVLEPNVWRHYAFTFDNATSTGNHYLDGFLVTGGDVGNTYLGKQLTATNQQVLIALKYGYNGGGQIGSTGIFAKGFNGYINYVNMFDRPLAASEIAVLCNTPTYTQSSVNRGLMTLGIENEPGTVFNDRIALMPANGAGFVGINTKTPACALDVIGSINATGPLSVAANTTIYDLSYAFYGSSALKGGVFVNNTGGGSRLILGAYYSWGINALSAIQSSEYYNGVDYVQELLLNPLGGVVGINTKNPNTSYALDVNGTGVFSGLRSDGNSSTNESNAPDSIGAGTNNHNLLLGSTKTGSTPYAMALGVDYTSGFGYINVAGNSTTQPLCLQTRGSNVGIGNTNPTSRLDVNGNCKVTTETLDMNPSVTIIKDTETAANFNAWQTRAQLQIQNFAGQSISLAMSTDGVGIIQGRKDDNGTPTYRNISLNPINGNVGIGTTNPAHILSLGNTNGNCKLAVYDNGTGGNWFGIGAVSDNLTFGAGLAQSGTPQMVLSSGGNLGIGTTTPTSKLDVNGNMRIYESSGTTASATSGSLILEHGNVGGVSSIVFKSKGNSGSDYGYIQYYDNFDSSPEYTGNNGSGFAENGMLMIGVENDEGIGTNSDRIVLWSCGGSGFVGINTQKPKYTLDVYGNVNAFSYNATSDYRVKANVMALDASFNVDVLKPVTYTNTRHGRQDVGFIAHEVQEHYPFLVNGEKDGEQMQSLNYIGLIGILTKEIQDLKRRLAEHEANLFSVENSVLAVGNSVLAVENSVLAVKNNVRSVETTVRSVDDHVRSVEDNVRSVEDNVRSVETTVIMEQARLAICETGVALNKSAIKDIEDRFQS